MAIILEDNIDGARILDKTTKYFDPFDTETVLSVTSDDGRNKQVHGTGWGGEIDTTMNGDVHGRVIIRDQGHEEPIIFIITPGNRVTMSGRRVLWSNSGMSDQLEATLQASQN